MRRSGLVFAVGCLVAAVCLVGGLSVAPAVADPTMTITPDTGLVDGQTVTVTATGMTPLSAAGIAECVEGHGQDGCELENRQVVSTDENGGFTTTMVVHTMLATPIGPIDCRTSVESCVIGASTTFSEVGAVWTAMEFDPGARAAAPAEPDGATRHRTGRQPTDQRGRQWLSTERRLPGPDMPSGRNARDRLRALAVPRHRVHRSLRKLHPATAGAFGIRNRRG